MGEKRYRKEISGEGRKEAYNYFNCTVEELKNAVV